MGRCSQRGKVHHAIQSITLYFAYMQIHEPQNRIDVVTPKGDGVIWLVTEYGHETDTIYTIILNDGTIWQFTHKDILVKDNVTFNRVSQKQR